MQHCVWASGRWILSDSVCASGGRHLLVDMRAGDTCIRPCMQYDSKLIVASPQTACNAETTGTVRLRPTCRSLFLSVNSRAAAAC
jgi:hypothetical protein